MNLRKIFLTALGIITGIIIFQSLGEIVNTKVAPYAAFSNANVEIFPIINTRIKTKELYTREDLYCLAKNIFHEAGVESDDGKEAVAQVTINRLQSKRWGSTICEVVFAPSQFSWTLSPQKVAEKPEGVLWERSVEIAKDFLVGGKAYSKLRNSLFYHADWIKKPKWASKDNLITQVDSHLFYSTDVKVIATR